MNRSELFGSRWFRLLSFELFEENLNSEIKKIKFCKVQISERDTTPTTNLSR